MQTMALPRSSERTDEAARLMLRFAERTGLTSGRAERRYLWTDAFASCNFLGLARATAEARHVDLARRLIQRVHHDLGQHRRDDARSGWLSGLGAEQGEAHPTRSGLRIGKQLPERRPDQPFDERLEWERDGQYFHYLTKWMHALDQVARSTAEPRFNLWARELAKAAHDAFVHRAPGSQRPHMYWKMSIDLSRPLVRSMGQHDALDGFITCVQLQATVASLPGADGGPGLDDETTDFASMIDAESLGTADPLGIGGLLADACRLEQLAQLGSAPPGRLCDALLVAALSGLEHYAELGDLARPAARRLAFRELGLAIGLRGIAWLLKSRDSKSGVLEALRRHALLGSQIVDFWMEPEHRANAMWSEHQDINDVMLATALAPDGYLLLSRPA